MSDTIQKLAFASLSFNIAGDSVLCASMVADGYKEVAVVCVPAQNKAMRNVEQCNIFSVIGKEEVTLKASLCNR